MIQQVGMMQQTIQPSVKQASCSAKEDFEKHLQDVNNESDEITVDKYGYKKKYGLKIGLAEFGEYFTKEQIQRWQQSVEDVDPTYRAFSRLVDDLFLSGYQGMSMSYFDFCYLLEQGQIVNEQNVGFTEDIIKSRNWDYSVTLTETFGVRDIEGNKRQLDIMRTVMDLGMVSKDKGLMSPEDVRELLAKKKYKEQQLLLERAFEKKHLLQQQLQSNE